MKTDRMIGEIDRMIERFDRKFPSEAGSAPKPRNYEAYVIVCIAVFIIIAGLVAVSFLDKPHTSGSFVVIDRTSPHYDDAGFECEEGASCAGWKDWAKEEEIEKADAAHVTAAAVAVPGEKPDIAWMAANFLAFLSLIIAVSYAIELWRKGIAPSVSWLMVSYWLLMAGIPVSIYYFATRGSHPIAAYIAAAAAIVVLLALALKKPWERRGITELGSINRLIAENNYDMRQIIGEVREEKKEKALPKFIEKLMQGGWKRKYMLEGVKEGEIGGINKGLGKLTSGPDVSAEITADVESSIAEREKKIAEMNKQLKKWAGKGSRK